MTNQNQKLAKATPTQVVRKQVSQMKSAGILRLPANYDADGAIQQAYFILSNQTDKNGNNLLQSCDENSIKQSLLEMVTKGLSPAKKQCYFIKYGSRLVCQTSYEGKMAQARRMAGMTSIKAQAVWAKDEFAYDMDANTGMPRITKHETGLSNATGKKADIAGAYCIVKFADGTEHVEIMSKPALEASWSKSRDKNQSMHNQFPDEAARKTVVGRALKWYIDSSDDSDLEAAGIASEAEITDQQDAAPEWNDAEYTVDEAPKAPETPENDHPPAETVYENSEQHAEDTEDTEAATPKQPEKPKQEAKPERPAPQQGDAPNQAPNQQAPQQGDAPNQAPNQQAPKKGDAPF